MSKHERPDEVGPDATTATAAEVILRSLRAHDVEYVFGNFGTDHTPILEAASRLREEDADAIPETVICPHESVALSAAHGYAVTTGTPQAVIVHVDVGTQNLGAMVHNAHRGNAPVFIIAGLSPVSTGTAPGARDSYVHYLQDIYDQPGIIRQFCRWTQEYRPPADPDETIRRGLELASTAPRGPVYLSATREALETPVPTGDESRPVAGGRATPADMETVDRLASRIAEATAPLLVTSKLPNHAADGSVSDLVAFAERAGVGVLERGPAALNFPRTHEMHVGFRPEEALERTDLIVLAAVDVPWLPGTASAPDADLPVIHIDVDPKKPDYPRWDFPVDLSVQADPGPTLRAVGERLDREAGTSGRETWRTYRQRYRDEVSRRLEDHRSEGRLSPEVLSATVNEVLDDSSVVVNETTTNNRAVLEHLELDRPGSYFASHGSGLGWAPGAAIGTKLARPETRVVSLVGDGSYVFANPTAAAWVGGAHDAPTLTVIYNNSGWNAVRSSTLRQHPDGSAAASDVPESKFTPSFDLSHATHVVDAHSSVVESVDDLQTALTSAVDAVDDGVPAVVDVRIEPI